MSSNRNVAATYAIVWGYLGVLIMITGGILLLPLILLIAYPTEAKYTLDFIIPALTAFVVGGALSLLLRRKTHEQLTLRQDTLIIVGGWILAAFFCALPFVLSGQLNFTQAMFEAVSGWTTTGLSVVDVTKTPHVFLMHRSLMQFFGGIGIVLVMVSALSGTYGMRLYNLEGHADRLLPNLRKSARIIIAIYSAYILAGTALYIAFGMPWFDAINHSIAALSTGGFSTQPNSIGQYNSLPIELITIILMLLGTTNFAAHLLLVSGKFKRFFQLGEVRFMFLVLFVSIPLMAFVSLDHLYKSVPEGIRVAAFNAVSAMSTTGFSTVSYNNWSPFAIFVMIILMLIGGGAGSTAGAIKLYRVYLLCKSTLWSLKSKFHPEHMVNKPAVYRPDGKMFIEDVHVAEVSLYAFVYMVLFFIGVAVMAAYGYSLENSMFEFASTIGTVGLSVGVTAPNTPPVVLWTQIAGMLFGRLEIYVIFIAAIKVFKDTTTAFKRRRSEPDIGHVK